MADLQDGFHLINTNILAGSPQPVQEQGLSSLLASLLPLAPTVQEGARIIFSNQNLTVNYGLAFLTVATVIALLLKLFFGLTMMDVMDAMTGAYGSTTGYSADTSYSTGYSAPASGYGSTDTGYTAPSDGYSSRSAMVELTPEQASLYPELHQLQEQLKSVKEAEVKLRRHIFYQDRTRGDLPTTGGDIGYSY